jgi:hypothetical protein
VRRGGAGGGGPRRASRTRPPGLLAEILALALARERPLQLGARAAWPVASAGAAEAGARAAPEAPSRRGALTLEGDFFTVFFASTRTLFWGD